MRLSVCWYAHRQRPYSSTLQHDAWMYITRGISKAPVTQDLKGASGKRQRLCATDTHSSRGCVDVYHTRHVTRKISKTMVARSGSCASQTHMIYEGAWMYTARKTSMSTAVVASGPRRRSSQEDFEDACLRKQRLCAIIDMHDSRGCVDAFRTRTRRR